MEKVINKVLRGSEYTVTITGLGVNGEGIGRIDGVAVFVEGTVPGDLALVRVCKVLKGYCYGELVEIIEPSINRVDAVCPVYSACGGCCLQELNYDAQLSFKQELVENALQRIGGFKDFRVNKIIGMADPLHYRNKAQFPVGIVNGERVLGFYSRGSHNLNALSGCVMLPPVNDIIIYRIGKFLNKHAISVYDEKEHTGLVRHVLIKKAFATGEIMVCIVINGNHLPHSKELAGSLFEVEGMKCVCLNVNTAKTNVILGSEIINIRGDEYITDILGGLRFRISPLSFYQVNPAQTDVLYRKAMEYAGSGNGAVVDAYCGIGTVALYFAKNGKNIRNVTGIEIVGQAVRDAVMNAADNGIEGVSFIEGDAGELAEPVLAKTGAETIVLDPPRKGCDVRLLNAVINSGVKKVVYISCEPSTLARDLKFLTNGGFLVEAVQPVDMFPYTSHVECVVLMSRRDG